MEIKKIRSKSEIKKVIELFIKVFSETPYNEKWKQESVLKRLNDIYERGKGYCVYLEQEGKPVGFAFGYKQEWDDGTHIMLEDVGVHPDYRRHAVASTMLQDIERTARQENITSIDLLADQRAKALLFWKKQGYKPTNWIQLKKKIE